MTKTMVLVLLLALAVAGGAEAAGVGVGVFGGASVPILQEDAGRGTVYGLRLPVDLVPMLRLEPYWAKARLGDVEETFGGLPYTRDGGEISTFGLHAMLSTGGPLRFFPFVGIGSCTLAREATDDRTKVGYDAGVGLGLSPIPGLEVDLRGEFVVIPMDETSRKFVNVTLGASYHFLNLP
jgi:opacity protein-like surface antigen